MGQTKKHETFCQVVASVTRFVRRCFADVCHEDQNQNQTSQVQYNIWLNQMNNKFHVEPIPTVSWGSLGGGLWHKFQIDMDLEGFLLLGRPSTLPKLLKGLYSP